MFWQKLSITRKLFLAIALSSALVILVMSVLIAISMRSGFSHYLVQAELGRFDVLVQALSREYDKSQSGWPSLQVKRENWHKFVRSNLPRRRPPPGRGPAKETNDQSKSLPGKLATDSSKPTERRRPPRHRDPLQLGQRLVLLDPDLNYIAGALLKNSVAGRRPVEISQPDGGKKIIGWLALVAPEGRPLSGDGIFLRGQINNLIYASIVALILSGLAAAILSRQLVAPIHRIAEATRALANRNYTERLHQDRNDELGGLIDDFNVLAENLQKSQAAERQWISDTSHELQTPVSILRAGIEALQDGVRQPDQENLAELHASVMRLSLLVSDISLLSNAREGKLVIEKSEEDIEEIIAAAAADAEILMENSGIEFCKQLEPGVIIDCDRFRIRQLIDNLLENARRYTAAPGRVMVKLEADEYYANIMVVDTAPAPPQEAYEKMFDRFYRAEPSRSREHGGSGLGLAICQEIVRAHEGAIKLAPSTVGGLKVMVRLPLQNTEVSEVET